MINKIADVLQECSERLHSIELAPGVVTPGQKTLPLLELVHENHS